MFINNIDTLLHTFDRRVYTVYTVPRYILVSTVSTRIIIFHFMLVNIMNILFVNIDDDGLGAYDCYMERSMQCAL